MQTDHPLKDIQTKYLFLNSILLLYFMIACRNQLNLFFKLFLYEERNPIQPTTRIRHQSQRTAWQRSHRRSICRYPILHAGKTLTDQTPVAVKIIDLKTIDNEVTKYLLDMEKIAIMSVNNPHVLRGIKVVQNKSFCYIVTELCNGGSLKNALKINGSLGE